MQALSETVVMDPRARQACPARGLVMHLTLLPWKNEMCFGRWQCPSGTEHVTISDIPTARPAQSSNYISGRVIFLHAI